jgi:hypothetical protein
MPTFSGFGIDRMVPEQAAALQALAAIGGREAAQAVSQLIVRGVVQGPTLNLAASTAARIGSTLPTDVLRSLLRHPDPGSAPAFVAARAGAQNSSP